MTVLQHTEGPDCLLCKRVDALANDMHRVLGAVLNVDNVCEDMPMAERFVACFVAAAQIARMNGCLNEALGKANTWIGPMMKQEMQDARAAAEAKKANTLS